MRRRWKEVAWHWQTAWGLETEREEPRRRARRVGPRGSACGVVFPVPRAEAAAGDGDVPWRWGRRRSRTNGWERVPGPPVAPALARVIRPRQSRTLLALFVFLYSFSLFFFRKRRLVAVVRKNKKKRRGAFSCLVHMSHGLTANHAVFPSWCSRAVLRWRRLVTGLIIKLLIWHTKSGLGFRCLG